MIPVAAVAGAVRGGLGVVPGAKVGLLRGSGEDAVQRGGTATAVQGSGGSVELRRRGELGLWRRWCGWGARGGLGPSYRAAANLGVRAWGGKAGEILGEDHGFGCAREGDESDYGARAVSGWASACGR